MGHQINFYITQEDLAVLRQRWLATEPMHFLHRKSSTDLPSVIKADEPLDHIPWVYLVRAADLSTLVLKHVASRQCWTIDEQVSPVIELMNCVRKEERLLRGRLYYTDRYADSSGWVDKAEVFSKWSKRLLGVTRRTLKKQGTDYIGTGAIEFEKHGGQLVSILVKRTSDTSESG